jgi:hypothetical protein
VEVAIDTSDARGSNIWRVGIAYDDGRSVVYGIRALVVRTAPSRVSFAESKRGSKSRAEFSVFSLDGRQLSIRSADYDRAYFDITWRQRQRDPGEQIVTVVQRDSIPFGGFVKSLRLNTDESLENSRQIELSGRVTKPMVVEPQELNFGIVGERENVRRLVRLKAPYGGQVTFLRYEAEPGGLISVGAATRDATDLVVPVELTPPRRGDAVAGWIRFIGLVNGREEADQIDYYVGTKQ